MSIKAVWWSFFYSFFSLRPFDWNIWSSFVYCFFWAQPFDKNMWSSFIYSFFCPRPFNQTLGSTLIYFFYLYTTIWPKIRVFIDIFLSFDRSTKNRVLLNLLLLFAHDHSKKLGVTLTLLFNLFLDVPIFCLLYSWQILPLYFHRSVSGSTAFIIRPLYS